jgi:signal transduction histidine kinase/CheY-like chemotaxis protein
VIEITLRPRSTMQSLAAFLLLGWLVSFSAWAQAIILTSEELAWITANPTVRIGNPSLPPYHYSDNGQHTGYQVEMLDSLLNQVGLRPEYVEVPLAELLDGMRSGKYDVIMDPIYKKEREEFIIFSTRSFDITLGIFARYDRKDITDLASLKGKRIGSYRDYALEAKLRKLLPESSVVQAEDSEGMLRLVSTGTADFCVVELRAGEFILQKEQISNVATQGVFQAPGEVAARAHDYGVRKTLPLLASILDKAVQSMDPGEKQRIWKRWFASAPEPDANPKFSLTSEERAWLAAGHTVRVRVADYPPYMFSKPAPSGMSVDYLSAVAKHLGFKVEFVQATHGWPASMQDVMGARQHYDLLLTMSRTPEREQQFSLSLDYLAAPWVIYTRNDSPYISGLDALKGKTVAAEKSYVITEKLKSEYPSIRILEVARSTDALHAVASGQADAYVGNLANATYLIKEQQLQNLMVSAPTPFGNHTQAMALRKDWAVLAGLIDKGIDAMTLEERNAINQKWGAIEVRPRVDYTLVWQIIAAATLILLAIGYWNRRLTSEIARRLQVEHDLRQAKDGAEAASRAKSTFLANMSHELRTPMNAIMGMTGLALRRASDPTLRNQLGKIDQASQHLLAVINDILDISKIEAERLTLERVSFRLGEVVENILSLISQKAQDKKLKLSIDLTPDVTQLSLLGDPLRLGQILLNFTSNAVKFTALGSITVRARVVEESAINVVLRFEVQDTGIGIAPQDQLRLFTAFEQADGSMTRKYGGTGLGLAISKRLAHLMGGEVGVESQVGTGSTFWFIVRLDKATNDAIAPAPTFIATSPEQQLKTLHAGARILVVEDEPINREVARFLLEDTGLKADLAEDGAVAVTMAKLAPYDLILMDMQMPNLNGVDATRAIRALPGYEHTPILAMTANAFDEDRKACFDAGMNDHLPKPIEPDQLFATMAKWLAQPQR